MSDINGKWLREIGFSYHAIRKYYYRNTLQEVLIVEAKDSESDPDVQWFLSAVAGHIDPADYTELKATLSTRATKQDVSTVLEMCDRFP